MEKDEVQEVVEEAVAIKAIATTSQEKHPTKAAVEEVEVAEEAEEVVVKVENVAGEALDSNINLQVRKRHNMPNSNKTLQLQNLARPSSNLTCFLEPRRHQRRKR